VGFSRTLNEGDLHENITIYGQPDYGHLKVERSRGSVPDLCSGNGISSASVYKWRAEFGGMDALLMKCMKELVYENRRLKKCTLKNGLRLKWPRTLLQKTSEASAVMRTGLQGKVEFGVSIRVACEVLSICKPVIFINQRWLMKMLKLMTG